MAAFREIVDLILNGEDINAPVTNRPLSQLLENCLYLRDLMNSVVSSQALYVRNAALKSSVLVGQPVYYNSANGRFEEAVADGTNKQNVVGVCKSKASATVGDLLTLGYDTLDLTNALDGVGLAAGRYYLKTASAGKIQAAQPTPSVVVLIADGAGNVFVIPQIADLMGPQGFQGVPGVQGVQGSQGSQGFQGDTGGAQGAQGSPGSQGDQGTPGAQGSPGAQGAAGNTTTSLVSQTGTTTDAYVSIYDSGTVATGLLFHGTFKNTGGTNAADLRVTYTDAFGNSENIDSIVSLSSQVEIPGSPSFSTAAYPMVRIEVLTRANVGGSQTTYNLKLTVAG